MCYAESGGGEKKYLPVEGQEGDFKEEIIASLRKERNGMFSIICLQLHASRVGLGESSWSSK